MQTPTELQHCAAILAESQDYRVLTRFSGFEVPGDTATRPFKPEGVVRGMIVDTETTGLDPLTDKVVEFGAVTFDFDPVSGALVRIVDCYQGLEDPGMPIPEAVSRLNGITDAMVRGHRLDDERIERMLESVDLVIAHNANFDRKILEARLDAFKDKAWACSQQGIDWASEGIGGQKLDYIAYRYGFFYDAHRATADCMALLEILRRPLPLTHETGLLRLAQSAEVETAVIYAQGAPFEKKDLMKGRGYRWTEQNPNLVGGKAWGYTVHNDSGMELFDEIDWLRINVYNGRKFTVAIETMDARTRFSGRDGLFTQENV